MRRGASALAVLLGTWLAVAHVAAQATTPTDELEARALFEAGQQAVEESRFDDARRLFERSLERHATPAAAFNAAVAAEEAGDLPAAIRHLERLLAGEHGALLSARRDAVAGMREAMLERVATLVVRTDRPVQVQIGERTYPVADERTIRLAPGSHTLHLEVAGRAPRQRELTLEAGERRTLDWMLEARVDREIRTVPPETGRADGSPPAGDGDLGLIVWLSVGAALVVGAGIAIGIGVHESQGLPDGFVGRAETLVSFP